MDNNKVSVSLDFIWVMVFLVILLVAQMIVSVMAISEARQARDENAALDTKLDALREDTVEIKYQGADFSRKISIIREELDLVEDLLASET